MAIIAFKGSVTSTPVPAVLQVGERRHSDRVEGIPQTPPKPEHEMRGIGLYVEPDLSN